MTRQYALNMLGRVHEEFDAGRFAIGYVVAHWHDPLILTAGLRGEHTRSDLRRCAVNLEMTFVLRLFSEFEAMLRDYWQNDMNRSTEPGMSDLMGSIANSRSMNVDDLSLAHDVREFRNELAHENTHHARLDFPVCQRRLGCYLRWLPRSW